MKTTNKHKKILRITICAFVGALTMSFLHFSSYLTSMATIIPSADGATNDNQRIIQEVAKAFYLKGDSIQYELPRRDQFIAPEDITSQSAAYMVCSSFTYAIYYNAFGLVTPLTTKSLNAYGHAFHDVVGHDDIVMYREGEMWPDTTAGKASLKNELLANLQVGDMITYYSSDSNSGHVVLVYDFEFDDSNNKTDAIVLHAVTSYKKNTNKLWYGLSWNNNEPNSITGIDEGTLNYDKLDRIINWITRPSDKNDYFMLYRPLALGGSTYNRASCDDVAIEDVECSSEPDTFATTNTSLARLNYPGIQIEKTVNVFNGSVVKPGDTLTYDIAITNNSDSAYQNISIVENIPTNLVTASGGASQLNWTISSIAPGATSHQQYSVTVKNDTHLYGQQIISTGSVAGIPSAKVTNTIGNNLTSAEKASIVNAYNNLKNTYSGAKLIDQIYTNALGANLDLENAKLFEHHNATGNPDWVKNVNSACNPYFSLTDNGALLKSQYGKAIGRNAMLNTNHALTTSVLNNYYSSLYYYYKDTDSCECTMIHQKYWNEYENDPAIRERSARAIRVYPETLQTGDVLIYANTGTTKQNSDPITQEDGIYAFVWIEGNQGGNFYGVNSLVNGSPQNEIYGVNNESANSLQTLFGKDYYVILRPALSMVEESEDPTVDPDDTKPDDEPADGSNTEIDGSTTEEPTIPNTGSSGAAQSNSISDNLMVAGFIIGTALIYLSIKNRKHAHKINFK